MAALKNVVVDRCDDNTLRVTVEVPVRHNGEPNFGALGRVLADLERINPDAYDARPVPPHVFADADADMGLKAGEAMEAGREHAA